MAVVHGNTHGQSDAQIGGHHRGSAAGEERQGDADNRQNAQAHTHIHNGLGDDHRKDAHTDEPAQLVLGPAAHLQHPQAEGGENPQHQQAAHKAQGLADEGEDEVVVHLRDILVVSGEDALAPELARTQGDASQALLIAAAGGVEVGVKEGDKAHPLVLVHEAVPDHRQGSDGQAAGAEDILPGQPGGKEHTAGDAQEHDGRSMVALEHDEQHRYSGMAEHRHQNSGLVEVVLHLLQVVGEGDDKGELEQLRGLEGEPHKRDLQPGHVIGTADAQNKGEQHQEVGRWQMEPPQIRHGLVVNAGDHHHGTAAQAGGDDLDDDTAGLHIAGIPDAGEQHHTEGGRKQAQPPDDFIGEFIVADNNVPDFFHLLPPYPEYRERDFSLSFYYKPRNTPAQAALRRIHSLDTILPDTALASLRKNVYAEYTIPSLRFPV